MIAVLVARWMALALARLRVLLLFAFVFAVLPWLLIPIVPLVWEGAAAFLRWLRSATRETEAASFRLELAEHPRLAELWRKASMDFKLGAVPRSIRLGIYPQHSFRRGEVTLSLVCLGLWTVPDLACHIAQTARRRRFSRIFRDAHQVLFLGPLYEETPLARLVDRLRESYWRLRTKWERLANMEADVRVARKYGARAVEHWISAAALVDHGGVECVVDRSFQSASHGLVIPIANSSREWCQQSLPSWNAIVESSIENPWPEQFGPPLRILTLRQMPDPAPWLDTEMALDLLDNIGDLEEAVLRQEAGIPAEQRLVRAQADAVVPDTIPADMRAGVERNSEILAGKSLSDLPQLVSNAKALAPWYREKPGDLYSLEQRQARMEPLLAGFLATELEKQGWSPRFSVQQGFVMERNGQLLNPAEVVAKLASGELKESEFSAWI
ncbi:MAG: hypothetical protein U0Q16_18280 [Bryobacteraceae bacterium]